MFVSLPPPIVYHLEFFRTITHAVVSMYETESVVQLLSSYLHCLQNRGESQPCVAVYGSEPSVSHHSGEYVCHVVIYTNNKFCKL